MRIRRIVLFLTTFVFVFALFSFLTMAYQASDSERIRDDKGVLSSAQKSELEQKLASAEEKCNVDIRVFIYDYSRDSTRYDIPKYERKVGQSFDDLVLLIISYEYGEYYYELFTSGEPNETISDNEADRILDNKDVYNGIKSGNIYSGIDSFITLSEKALNGTLTKGIGKVIIPAILISLAVASMVSLVAFLDHRRKIHSASYPLNKYARLDLNVSTDSFINKSVSRVRVRSESSSSGGRGGGVSFGGSRGRR